MNEEVELKSFYTILSYTPTDLLIDFRSLYLSYPWPEVEFEITLFLDNKDKTDRNSHSLSFTAYGRGGKVAYLDVQDKWTRTDSRCRPAYDLKPDDFLSMLTDVINQKFEAENGKSESLDLLLEKL
jgi:hypothetical protein